MIGFGSVCFHIYAKKTVKFALFEAMSLLWPEGRGKCYDLFKPPASLPWCPTVVTSCEAPTWRHSVSARGSLSGKSCVRDGKLTGCSFKTDSSAGPLKLFLTVLHSRNETYHVVGIVPGAEVVVMVEAR